MYVFHIKQGDTSPAMEALLKDHDGVAVDLAGATVKVSMSDDRDILIIDNAPAIVVDAAEGRVRYLWQAGDTDRAGPSKAEFEVTFSGGDVETFPNRSSITVDIEPQIG